MKIVSAKTIRGEVNRRKDEIIEWTKTLIRFPSENRPPDGNEAEAQGFFRKECTKLGWETSVFSPEGVEGIKDHPSWLSGRNYPSGREDVVARWKGRRKGKSLLFSGHMDVAPYEPDNWKMCRPYEPVAQDGRLYGRGSADLKGGFAAAFWALKILREIDFEPAGDILIESVVDEEFAGGNGTLASRLKGFNADLAVLTEPTRMEVCPACLGAFLGDLTLRGRAGMPYMGSEIPNPIQGAGAAIRLFYEWQKKWRSGNTHPLFKETGKQLNVVLWCIDSKTPDEFTQMGTPLLTKISWIVWCYPGMTEEEFYRQFREFWENHAQFDPDLKSFKLEITPDYHYVRPWETDPRTPAVREVIRSYEEYFEEYPVVGGAPFSCDLALYGDTGKMPTIILGPRGDNLHAPDEWVLIEDIFSLSGLFAYVAARWCGEPGPYHHSPD